MLEVLQVLMWGNEARVLDLHRANVTTDTLKGLKWSRKVCENQAGGCEGLVGAGTCVAACVAHTLHCGAV